LQNLFKNKLFVGALVALCLGLSAMLWRRPPEEDKLVVIDGAVITRQQLEASLGRQLSQLNQQIYNLKRQKLDQLVHAQLLTERAKRVGVSVETLLEQEVNNKVPPVSEEEIQNFYEKNKQRIPVQLDKVHDQIRDYLRDQRIADRKSEYFKSLRAKAEITTYLKPPAIHRAAISIDGAPFKGAERAPVTFVKFEDFECPFCKSVQPTLTDVLKKYDGKVRVVHKDLPLEDIHRQAHLAAQAARCAGDQGKFWEYHDTLYGNAPKLGVAELKTYAKNVGLDAAPFEQCLSSGKYKAAVQKDLSEGAKLGLTGTPTFFINGREISGALPVESFAAIIDDELAGAK
jgi:protein-disulfide isomerase